MSDDAAPTSFAEVVDGGEVAVAVEPEPRLRDRLRAAARRRLTYAILAPLALAAAGATLTTLNYLRADEWQRRAVVLDRQKTQLNELLVGRTGELNRRIEQLNAMATQVRKAEQSLRRSEADVASLEQRQRELANEKAQVEDQRQFLAERQGALEGVASSFIDCKGGLVSIVGYLAREDYYSANYYWSSVRYDCDYAENALQGYLAAYGG